MPRLSFGADGNRFGPVGIGTNVSEYACLLTLNAELELPVSRQWSITVQGRYNPWTFRRKGPDTGRVQWRKVSVMPGFRYWPWHVHSGWFAGGGIRWSRYNIGGLSGKRTYEGDFSGGALFAGYALMLTPRINLELGAGVLAGRTSFTEYACPACGRKTGSGRRWVIYPDTLLIQFKIIL